MSQSSPQLMAPLLAATMLITSSIVIAEEHSWDYQGEHAPSHWGENPNWRSCSDGKNQSPIDISATIKSQLPELQLDYNAGGDRVLNNGHTIQISYQPGSTLNLDGTKFELKQFHFHSPSENHIDGKSYPLEAHLVHADTDGNLAVIGILFEERGTNSVLAAPWSVMPTAHQEAKLNKPLEVSLLLPESQDYYRFNGSLTTPPCSEGVRWLVMKQPVNASKQQIRQFRAAMGRETNRPIQPLHARRVME